MSRGYIVRRVVRSDRSQHDTVNHNTFAQRLQDELNGLIDEYGLLPSEIDVKVGSYDAVIVATVYYEEVNDGG